MIPDETLRRAFTHLKIYIYICILVILLYIDCVLGLSVSISLFRSFGGSEKSRLI